MKDYKNLNFWLESHKLALDIYKLTRSFLKKELYALTSQLKRAALSIPTNIVEGCGRESTKEFKRFLVIASGSAAEIEPSILFFRDWFYK